MATQMTGIMRGINRDPDKPLNILCAPTHERYQSNLAQTGHNFYLMQHQTFVDWKLHHAPLPDNHILLSGEEDQIKTDMQFDLILSQNKFSQCQIFRQVQAIFQVPILSLEHTVAGDWTDKRIQMFTDMKGDVNVFISDYSRKRWGFDESNSIIIHHGVDTKQFIGPWVGDDKRVLTVANDYINRDWCLGFNIWRNVTQGLPVNPVGDTPGLSEAITDVDKLIQTYRKAAVFLNTSTYSPVPTSLLEAMACGCPVVTMATCMMPDIIQNGVNGFITNDPKELRQSLIAVLQNPKLGKEMGEKGRQTVIDMFGLDRFVSEWNDVLIKTAGMQRKF